MKKGKITNISPRGEYSNASGIFNKYQVRFDDGQEFQFLAKGSFKKEVGQEVEYEITNAEYKTAKLVYSPKPTTQSKDVTISKLACLKASAEFHATRPQSDRVSVLEDARHYYNWIISN